MKFRVTNYSMGNAIGSYTLNAPNSAAAVRNAHTRGFKPGHKAEHGPYKGRPIHAIGIKPLR
jgi:hypothetical protein